MTFIFVEQVQLERLVCESQPESSVSVHFQRFDRTEQNYVAHVELDEGVKIHPAEKNRAVDVPLSNFRTTDSQTENKIQIVSNVGVQTASQIPRFDDPIIVHTPLE